MALLGGWRITRTGITFVVGLLVLTGLVFGGIWLVHDRGEQARRQDAAEIARLNLEEQSKTTNETNNGEVSAPATEEETEDHPATGVTNDPVPLPETGPELTQIIIIALVTLATAYYVTSRRAVRSL